MLKLFFSIFVLIFIQANFIISLAADTGFIENKGQIKNQDNEIASEVLYIFNSKNLKITLREQGFSYERFESSWSDADIRSFVADEYADAKIPFESHRIDFTFPNRPSEVITKKHGNYSLNYYNKTKHPVTDVKQYESVIYKNVADGIDVEFVITSAGGFKYNILVDGSADLSSFFLSISGADGVSINKDGSLMLDNSIKQIKEQIPESFYVSSNASENVDVNYKLEDNKLYFETAKDYSDGELIIDPEPDLVWGSYFGGSGSDQTTGLAVDEEDNAFQTGITLSINNISTTGAYQTNYTGDLDVYVSKLDASGTLLWSTYYGDVQSERAYSIAVDDKGDAYLGGNTFSVNGISTPGVYQEYLFGGDDMFILKLTENGMREWCTYYGGNAHDFITSISFYNDQLFVSGHSTSSNGITTPGAYVENFMANECAFIGCLNGTGTDLLWGTYFGEEMSTSGEDLVVFNDYVAMTGRTTSNIGIASPNAHQENHIGFVSGFVTLFDVQGNYQWGTYYGGDYSNTGKTLVVDEQDNIYVAGNSNSPNNISTTGAYQESPSDEHGFLVKFNIEGERIWGTYVGGNLADYINKIDYYNGNVILGGQTLSTQDIASTGVYEDQLNDGFDMFFTMFDTSGVFKWGTYYGGEVNEDLNDLSFLSNGNFYFVGSTTGSQNEIATLGSHQEAYGGGPNDGIIGLFCLPSEITIIYENGILIADGGTDIEWYFNGDPTGEYNDSIESLGDGVYVVVNTSDGKCESTSDEFVLNTVGLENEAINSEVLIYPNPVNKTLNIKHNEIIDVVRIFDITGREVFNSSFNLNEVALDLSDLMSGVYISKVFYGEKVYSYKFLKK